MESRSAYEKEQHRSSGAEADFQAGQADHRFGPGRLFQPLGRGKKGSSLFATTREEWGIGAEGNVKLGDLEITC
jgi:hypothetical protein